MDNNKLAGMEEEIWIWRGEGCVRFEDEKSLK